jgi:hypothetical protein
VVFSVVKAGALDSLTQPTLGGGQTLIGWEQNGASQTTSTANLMSYEAGAATVTMSATLPNALYGDWSTYGIALKPAGAAPATYFIVEFA